MSGPLEGIRIVDVSAIVSGPLAAMMLADQGADVVKVEPVELGDATRLPVNYRAGMSALFANCNRGKRAMALDLKAPAGREIVLDLVKQADVFIENWRPGAAERLGLGEDVLRKLNQNLIYTSISGYGTSGPYRDRRVYDPVIQAYTGMIENQRNLDTGEVDLVRNIVADKATAYTVTQAVVAALFARERGAGGQRIDVAMLDATLAFFWPDGMMMHTLLGDGVQQPICMADVYRVWKTSDGDVIAFFQSTAELTGLAHALDRPDWLDDENFTDIAKRLHPDNIERMTQEVKDAIARFTTDEILERFNREEVPVAPVLSRSDVADDPQVKVNQSIFERDHPVYGRYRQARPAPHFSRTPTEAGRDAPLHGEHTVEVLREIGYDDAKIEALRTNGVIA